MRSRYPPLPGTGPVDPRFRNGDLVRYDSGPTALFRITKVYPHYSSNIHRYHGVHCLGGSESRYDYQVEAANAEDEQKWFECEKWRRP